MANAQDTSVGKVTTALSTAAAAIASIGSSTIVGAIPAVTLGAIVAGVAAGVAGLNAVLGDHWSQTSGVRWLIQKYDYYVKGNASDTSDNKVQESMIQEAQYWYLVTLGVNVFDIYRLHALKGTNPTNGAPLNNTIADRVKAFKAYPENAQYSDATVTTAAQIADQYLPWFPQSPGAWANAPTADVWLQQQTALVQQKQVAAASAAINVKLEYLKNNWYIIAIPVVGFIIILAMIKRK